MKAEQRGNTVTLSTVFPLHNFGINFQDKKKTRVRHGPSHGVPDPVPVPALPLIPTRGKPALYTACTHVLLRCTGAVLPGSPASARVWQIQGCSQVATVR